MNLVRHDLTALSDLSQLAKSTYENGEIISDVYLNWEYKRNPAGNALIYVAENGKELASQYVLIPKKIKFGSETFKCSLSVNTITHPGHRGKGYFTKLAELTYAESGKKGDEFIVGFPNANSVNGFLSKLNFIEIGRLPLFLKLVNPFSAALNFIFKNDQSRSEEIEMKEISVNNVFSYLDLDLDEDQYLSFLNKIYQRNNLTTARSVEFMKWRYIEIPLRKYRLFKFMNGNEIEGIVVVRMKRIMGIRCCVFVDSLLLNDSISLKSLLKEIKRNKVDLFITTIPLNSQESKVFKKGGFFKLPDFLMFKKLHMIIRKKNDEMSNSITDFKQWFITFGDYDIF